MIDRPMVNVYEPDEKGVEQLVYRAMNDTEYAAWGLCVAQVQQPQPDQPVPASVAAACAVEAAMATVAITSPNLSEAQKSSIQSAVQAQVDVVIQEHLARGI